MSSICLRCFVILNFSGFQILFFDPIIKFLSFIYRYSFSSLALFISLRSMMKVFSMTILSISMYSSASVMLSWCPSLRLLRMISETRQESMAFERDLPYSASTAIRLERLVDRREAVSLLSVHFWIRGWKGFPVYPNALSLLIVLRGFKNPPAYVDISNPDVDLLVWRAVLLS